MNSSCFGLSPHEERRGWWTGCRCSGLFPPVWIQASSCILHTPARTPGSPRWTLSAGTSGKPECPLRRERLKVNSTMSFSFKNRSESRKLKFNSVRLNHWMCSHVCCWAETPSPEAAFPHSLWRTKMKMICWACLCLKLIIRVLYKLT